MSLRTIDEQFEPDAVNLLRGFICRLEAIRGTNEASDYFVFETISCIKGGLVLASMQIAAAALELRAREILIQNSSLDSADDEAAPFRLEIKTEEDRDLGFYGILGALERKKIISAADNQTLKDIYKNIRIPLHHGIVGRYYRSRDDGSDAWVFDALFGDNQAHLTTSQAAIEFAIESYGLDDLCCVISALEILHNCFEKFRFSANQPPPNPQIF
jgi:hypothetical protein